MVHLRHGIAAEINEEATLKKMKIWRKAVAPDNVPQTYQDFRDAAYSSAFRVARVHALGILNIDVKVQNGESIAIVFYDP